MADRGPVEGQVDKLCKQVVKRAGKECLRAGQAGPIRLSPTVSVHMSASCHWTE